MGAAAAGGAAVTVVGAPVVLTGLGFTQAGITAGSIGAYLMSASATTGYGAAVVAACQSAGAAGVGAATAATGAAGGLAALFLL